MDHAYWGPGYDDHEIESALQAEDLDYSILSEGEICDAVAELLVKNQIVGWFQGRAEIGPRALGARSILANPMIRANVTRVNTLKGREEWRPLAPSVLAEEFDVYFRGNVKSPFMNIAVEVRESARAIIPAVVHVDGSARPQAVSREFSPLYWQLINAFRRRTGVAVVLNTSFNLWSEPMVNSPREAIETFRRGNLDALAIGRYLVHG
jgi:carbamoyltransferase